MVELPSGITTILKKINVFKTPVSLRYDDSPVYDTVCGGFTTIALFTFFIVLFSKQWVLLFNKEYIKS
jgi:hypothetical protein